MVFYTTRLLAPARCLSWLAAAPTEDVSGANGGGRKKIMEFCHSSSHGRCYMIGTILDFTSYTLQFKNCLSP